MKKINSVVLSTLTAAFLVGCGGGSSSSTDSTSTTDTTTVTPASTTVPVTKGSLLKATAVDSSSPVKTGTQIDGTNKYTFTGDITYPITVTGGYVDVNDNGVVDEGDYEFTGKLTSYSTVVTPITTYLGDTSKDDGKAKLAALKTLAGITSDDDLLTKDPSETNEDVLALVASIYQSYPSLMDNDNSNDANTEGNQDLTTKFADYKSVISQGTFEGETVKQKLIRVEQQLRDTSGVDALSEFDIEKMNLSKEDFVGKKLVVENETYYFRENDVVLADSGEDYTKILSYDSIENGSVKVKFENGDYDLITLTESGFDISYYENGSLSETESVTNQLTSYTDTELTQVLADIPFTLTTAMLDNKVIYFNDSDGFASLTFGAYDSSFTSGSFYEYTHDTGESPTTCHGDWLFDSSKANTIQIDHICSDDDFTPNGVVEAHYSTTYITFNSEPKAGTEITYVDGNDSGSSLIDTIKDSFISGKSITFSDNANNEFTSTFGDGGSYTESGDDFSCSGHWADLGNNIIGGTCDDNGTTELPDGIVDENSNEITYTFTSTPLKVNDSITVTDADGPNSVKIISISDIQLP